MSAGLSWLSKYSKMIPVRGENVFVLKSPNEFYDALLKQVSVAKNRIKISSLYLGTGELERKLVHTIHSRLQEKPDLKCDILLDSLRGTRGCPNSVTLLNNTLQSTQQLRLYLYHTPLLKGVVKRLLPQRFNEAMGVQHTKIHLFDDNVLLTGANLSVDYFTKRRDRYILFKDSPRLADYISTLFQIIADHSYHLATSANINPLSADSVINPLSADSVINPLYDPLTQSTAHKRSMRDSINQLINNYSYNDKTHSSESDSYTKQTDTHSYTRSSDSQTDTHSNTHSNTAQTDTRSESDSKADTFVYPLIQMGPYDIHQDEEVTIRLLSMSNKQDRLYLASGYFNLPYQYSSAIMKSKGTCSVLAASPQANGFYGARGVAKYVPYMYVYFAKLFLKLINKNGLEKRINYSEYVEDGWTFHCKGLWYYREDHAHPYLSLIGSSNFGFRSLTRDLEFQVAIVTENKELQRLLDHERNRLFAKGKEMSLRTFLTDNTRQLSLPLILATKLLQRFV